MAVETRETYIERMRRIGVPVSRIASDLGVSRQTVYNLIAEQEKKRPRSAESETGLGGSEPERNP